jgi:hypothetical protein
MPKLGLVFCFDCVFWNQVGGPESESEEGWCRRHAPHPLRGKPGGEGLVYVDWPITLQTDSCGDGEIIAGVEDEYEIKDEDEDPAA